MSSNGQPPLTRRQVRDLERAREAGEAITGSISVVSGSPVPSAMPVTSPSPAVTQSAPPASTQAPGSAHTPTRRELRAAREASAPVDSSPVPLRAPKPEHERKLSDALSHVADIENGRSTSIVPPREAPRTVTPTPAETAAPASVPPSPATPASAPAGSVLPGPVSAGRPAAAGVPDVVSPVVSAPTTDGAAPASDGAAPTSADEPAPGPRRHGAAAATSVAADSAELEAALGQRLSAATPPPSSVPTVFPFALGSPSTPETADAPVPEPATSDPEVSAPEPSRGDPAVAASSVSAELPAASAGAFAVEPPVTEPTAAQAETVATFPTVAQRGTGAAAAAPSAAVSSASASPAAESSKPGASASAAAAPVAPRPQASIPASVPEPAAYVPPTGHWSTQADRDDDAVDSVGSHFGSMTSTGQHNALIIGNDQLPDVTGALNATGEVIITGSIDLPRSLAATGSHHAQRIDGSDIDRMLEEGDREQPDNDATPVRASRAVSANTSTRAVVLAAGKPRNNRLPIIATICGGVVILVIVGLVVVGFVTHVL